MTEPRKHPNEDTWKVCKVCSRVLEQYSGYDDKGNVVTTMWDHSPIDKNRGVDHPPVPVPYSEVERVRMVCDFCSAIDPLWELPVENFDIPRFYENGDGWGSTNNWTCCDVCADLINRGLWPQLTRRAVEFLIRNNRLPSSVWDQALADIQKKYRLVRKHQKGPVRLMEPAIPFPMEIGEGRSKALGGAHDPDQDPPAG